jgi:hypothetical protein
MFNPGNKRHRADMSGRSSSQLMQMLQMFLEKLDALEKGNDILDKIVRDGFRKLESQTIPNTQGQSPEPTSGPSQAPMASSTRISKKLSGW